MTNAQYLIVSYFSAAAGGLVAAIATAAALQAPVRTALVRFSSRVGRYVSRILPAWLVLAAGLAFVSVSYIDCDHGTYQSVIDDPGHMVAVTHQQIGQMFTYLAIGVFAYALALAILLVAADRARQPRGPSSSIR